MINVYRQKKLRAARIEYIAQIVLTVAVFTLVLVSLTLHIHF